jgi:hypothetical protein
MNTVEVCIFTFERKVIIKFYLNFAELKFIFIFATQN